MLIFEYRCKKCNKTFEEFVKKYDDEVRCPTCGEKVERSYSGKMYSATGKSGTHCTGNCATCGGCK